MRTKTRFYLITAIAMNIVMFLGFSQTYFAPLLLNKSAFGGNVSDLPFLVHIHGWSFFFWYLLLLWQASLIARSRHQLHRRGGIVSIGLAAIMTITGIVIMVVNINQSLQPGEPSLWRFFGPVILGLFRYNPLRYYVLFLPAYILLILEWLHLRMWRLEMPRRLSWVARVACPLILVGVVFSLAQGLNLQVLKKLPLVLGTCR